MISNPVPRNILSVSVRKETYDALESMKQEVRPKKFESFESVIIRLIDEHNSKTPSTASCTITEKPL